MSDYLKSARFAWLPQLVACLNGARLTETGLDGNGFCDSDALDPNAVTALQQALADAPNGTPGLAADGVFGQATATALSAYKQAEGLQPSDPVASVGVMTHLDQQFEHELIDAVAADFVGGQFDLGPRVSSRTDLDTGLAITTFQNGVMVELGYAIAIPVPSEHVATWTAAGGATGTVGVPLSGPYVTDAGAVAQAYSSSALFGGPQGVVQVPRELIDSVSGQEDLGDPTAPPSVDASVNATVVPFQNGSGVQTEDGGWIGLPADVMDAWRQAITNGQQLGLPTTPGAFESAAGSTLYGFAGGFITKDLNSGALHAEIGLPPVVKRYFFKTDAALKRRVDVPGAKVTWFVGGDAALPEMIGSIRRAKAAGAAGYVYLANWHCNSDLTLPPGGGPTLGAELQAAAAAGCQIRALLWSGLAGLQLPLPIIGGLEAFLGSWFHEQSRRNQKSSALINSFGGDSKAQLDDKTLPWGSAHQKVLVTSDGTQVEAFVGGIEWNTDRLSTDTSPGRPLFDIIAKIEGPGGHHVLQSWLDRWTATTGEALGQLRGASTAVPAANGSVSVQANHTYSHGHPFRRGITTAATALWNALQQAQTFFYMEDQYFDGNPFLGRALLQALAKPSVTGILVITNDDLNDQPDGNRQRQKFLQAIDAQSGGRLHIFTRLGPQPNGQLGTKGSRAYVHSKLLIVDDDVAFVGSVNSNHRGWTHDTEIIVTLQDSQGPGGTQPGTRGLARELRCQLWAHHLGVTPAQLGDPTVDIPQFLANAGNAPSVIKAYDDQTARPVSMAIPIIGPIPLFQALWRPLADSAFSTIIDPA